MRQEDEEAAKMRQEEAERKRQEEEEAEIRRQQEEDFRKWEEEQREQEEEAERKRQEEEAERKRREAFEKEEKEEGEKRKVDEDIDNEIDKAMEYFESIDCDKIHKFSQNVNDCWLDTYFICMTSQYTIEYFRTYIEELKNKIYLNFIICMYKYCINETKDQKPELKNKFINEFNKIYKIYIGDLSGLSTDPVYKGLGDATVLYIFMGKFMTNGIYINNIKEFKSTISDNIGIVYAAIYDKDLDYLNNRSREEYDNYWDNKILNNDWESLKNFHLVSMNIVKGGHFVSNILCNDNWEHYDNQQEPKPIKGSIEKPDLMKINKGSILIFIKSHNLCPSKTYNLSEIQKLSYTNRTFKTKVQRILHYDKNKKCKDEATEKFKGMDKSKKGGSYNNIDITNTLQDIF